MPVSKRSARWPVWILLAAAGAAGGAWYVLDGRAAGADRRASGARALLSIDVSEVRRQGRPPTAVERASGTVAIGSDDWTSEVECERTRSQLARLAARLAGEVEQGEGELLAPDFACQDLRPDELELRFERGPLRVWIPRAKLDPDGPARGQGAAGLGAALGELRAGLGAEGELQVELDTIGFEQGAGSFSTLVACEAGSRSGTRSTQQRADWRCRWVQPEDTRDPPLLAWIGLERFEEVALELEGGVLFEDCTASAFAGDPYYTSQVLPGIDHWLLSVSRVDGMSFGGHHGLALGDVDGDGLEDLYVCDAGGLPNRLYLQAPDGTLRDVSHASGVDWLEYSASALLVDLDGDGDPDLALATRPRLVLMENDGHGRFETRLELPAPLDPMSISAADPDADGDLDLYVCAYNRRPDGEQPAAPVPYHDANNGDANVFLRNSGGFRFDDATAQVGLDHNNTRYSFAAVWEDYDDDGDADLYVANDFGRNNLYRNDGGHFSDVAAAAGVEDIASGMSAAWGDYDRDGRVDLYVANMFSPAGRRVTLQPRFEREPIGAAAMDVRRMTGGNTLFRNAGDGSFEDTSSRAGAERGRWAWASRFTDFDNDGWQDLFVANGYLTMSGPGDITSFFWRQVVARSPADLDYGEEELERYMSAWQASVRLVAGEHSFAGHERDVALLNCGGGRFADASFVIGLDLREDGRGVAVVDWDQDGDLDLWLRNRTGPRLRLMRNRLDQVGASAGAYVALLLCGTSSNRDAIGARAEVELADPGAGRLVQSVVAGDGFLSQSSKWLHFGLGERGEVQRVSVRWPGGAREEFTGVAAGGRYLLVEGSGAAQALAPRTAASALAPAPQLAAPRVAEARALLGDRLPLPILRYEPFAAPAGAPSAPSSIEARGRPLLVLFFASWWPACSAALEELADARERLDAAGLDVLALSVDGLGAPSSEAPAEASPEGARRLLEALDFPWPGGAATPELIDKLELLSELLFELTPPFQVPCGLLVDAHGELAALYRGTPGVDALLADRARLDAPPRARRELATPFPGRWFGGDGGLDLQRVAGWYSGSYPEDAVRFLRAQVAREGGESQLALAEALVRAGELDEAVPAFRAAALADPGSVAALLGEARAHIARERPAEALAVLARALALDEANAEAHHWLGRAQQISGDVGLAIASYERALELDPSLCETRNNLGNLYSADGREAEALDQYRRALESCPRTAALHYNLGEFHRKRAEHALAVEAYRGAIAVDPELFEARIGAGLSLAQLGRWSEARAELEAVVVGRPDGRLGLLQLARLLTTAGDPAQRDARRAVELAQRASDLTQGRDLEVLQCLTEAQLAAGDASGAMATANRAYDAAVASGNQGAANAISAWIQAQGSR